MRASLCARLVVVHALSTVLKLATLLLQLAVAVAVGGAGPPAAGGDLCALGAGRVRQARRARPHCPVVHMATDASPWSSRRPKAGPCPPWPPPSLQRQPLHAKFGCNRRNRQPLDSRWRVHDGRNAHWSSQPGASCHCWHPVPAAAGAVSVWHQCILITCSTIKLIRCILTHRLVGMPRQRSAAPISPQRGPRAMRSNLIVLTLTRTSGHNLGVSRSASSATQARLHRTSHFSRRRNIFITAANHARSSGRRPAAHLEEARCDVGRRLLVDAVAMARPRAVLAARDRAGEARQPRAMGCRGARTGERRGERARSTKRVFSVL